jgi:hypothetical protein
LSVIWIAHNLFGLYSVVSGGKNSFITATTVLALLLSVTTVFALNRRGGETVRKAALAYALFWSVLGSLLILAGAWDWLANHKAEGKLAFFLGVVTGVIGGLTARIFFRAKPNKEPQA